MKPNIQANRIYIVAAIQEDRSEAYVSDLYWSKQKAKDYAKEALFKGIYNHLKVWEYKIVEDGTFIRFRKVLQAIPAECGYEIVIDL